jgi:hypothetical protein
VTGDEYDARLFFKNTNHHIFCLKQFCTLDGVVVNIEAVQHDGSKSTPRAANKC